MNSTVKTILLIIIGLAVFGAISNAINKNNGQITPEAANNTSRNAFVSVCKQEATKDYGSSFNADQIDSYCHCAEGKLEDKYGATKLFSPEFENNIGQNGFGTDDTDMLAPCVPDTST